MTIHTRGAVGPVVACVALATLMTAIGIAIPRSYPLGVDEAGAAQAPRGSVYCGRVDKDDSVTLVAFAHRVSCRYAVRFAHRCLLSADRHGWALRSDRGPGGLFKLVRGKSVIWLEDAGGTARCLGP